MKNHWKTAVLFLGTMLAASPQARSQITSPATVTGSGAVHATNGMYRVTGTLGQTAVGHVHTGAIITDQGFWNALQRTSTPSFAPDRPTPVASVLALHASPNPFSESTELRLSIPQVEHATLVLYDLLGQPVRTHVESGRHEGHMTLRLNADDLPAGRYTAVMTADGKHCSVSLTLIR